VRTPVPTSTVDQFSMKIHFGLFELAGAPQEMCRQPRSGSPFGRVGVSDRSAGPAPRPKPERPGPSHTAPYRSGALGRVRSPRVVPPRHYLLPFPVRIGPHPRDPIRVPHPPVRREQLRALGAEAGALGGPLRSRACGSSDDPNSPICDRGEWPTLDRGSSARTDSLDVRCRIGFIHLGHEPKQA